MKNRIIASAIIIMMMSAFLPSRSAAHKCAFKTLRRGDNGFVHFDEHVRQYN